MQMHTALTGSRSGFAPRAGIEAFFRRSGFFLWIVFVTLSLTGLITFLTPREYESSMKFLVQNARGNVLVTSERTNSGSASSDVTDTQVNSEVEILHSHDVIDPIANPQWESISERDRDPEAVRHHEKLLDAFEKKFRTETVPRTNVINVSILADTPDKAKQELEQLSTAFLAEHRRLQRPHGASDFFVSEAERIRKDWNVASQRLVKFQREHELLSLPNRQAALETRIIEHERDLLTTNTALSEMDAKLSGSSRRLQDLPMRQTTEEKVVPNPESMGHLNTLLVELQNKRTALLTNYRSDDRVVRELDQQIATTTAALNDASRMNSHEETTNVDPAWDQLHKEYVSTGVDRQKTEAHRATVTLELAQLKQDLASLQNRRVQQPGSAGKSSERELRAVRAKTRPGPN
jgi:uncharacterized protein involved in exopolysaccharide biosynthesis